MGGLQDALVPLEPEAVVIPAKSDPLAGVDMSALSGLAFCYTVGMRGGGDRGIRFGCTVADAMTWCSSPVSAGSFLGNPWAYLWTSVARFVETFGPEISLKGLSDDGRWDERIADAGVAEIHLWDFPEWLEPHGLRVADVPGRPKRRAA
ncbi:hypothetical protein GCM10009785_21850 [Brooklawnia cerclae]|uniref:Uncharacterized protein n=1 Tax=Brooklawnia cerclae TaxID=349934 RepID=A0ABX0SKS9_9ACTN|nr:hypothetical protein [Brooklawnia cerclae]NIH57296.1 hypothetical protein [Brooklawnia cerclae]